MDRAPVRHRLDAHLRAVQYLLQQDGGIPQLPAGVDRERGQRPHGGGQLRLVIHASHVHPRAQVDRLDDQRVADLPRGPREVGPLLVHGEARPRHSGVGEDPAGAVLAAGVADRLRVRARQAQTPGDPGRRGQVVVAGREDAVEAQYLVQPVDQRQQGVGVVGVGGDDVAGDEQRVRGPVGRRAEVVVQVAGEQRERVPTLPDRPWQQSAHRPDPALDHQQMTHNSPFHALVSDVRRQAAGWSTLGREGAEAAHRIRYR
ncbi:hypothetical protein EES39_32385 [Streptomyces sp. ADI92-24]|nr:hypothetical protein EES39_32385 [Streptomyces sp. ADI92-24]